MNQRVNMTSKADKIIHQIFVEELGVREDLVSDEVSYGDIPEWDSNSHIVIVVALEDALDVALDDDSIVELTSVGKIRQFIEECDQ